MRCFTSLMAAATVILAAAAALSGTVGCSAFVTPLTRISPLSRSRHLLNEAANNGDEQPPLTPTIDAKESFQRSLLAAQLSNTANSAKNENPNTQLLASLSEPVPPAGHSVESTETKTGTVHTLTVHLGQPGHPEPFVFETGRIGRQAAGAILLTRGDSSEYYCNSSWLESLRMIITI